MVHGPNLAFSTFKAFTVKQEVMNIFDSLKEQLSQVTRNELVSLINISAKSETQSHKWLDYVVVLI